MAGAGHALSAKEAEIYDRQIRLWGVEAQTRMRSSRILIVGLSGVGAEVAKNLVLAGMNVVLADGAAVEERHLGAQFFLTAGDVGKNRAISSLPRVRELNPHVEVTALPFDPCSSSPSSSSASSTTSSLSDADLGGFRAVILSDIAPASAVRFADRCRSLAVPVIVASSFGFLSFFFLDLGEKHVATLTRTVAVPVPPPAASGKNASPPEPKTVEERKEMAFKRMSDALQCQWSTLNPKFVAEGVYHWLALHRAAGAASFPGGAASPSAAAVLEEAKRCAAAANSTAEAFGVTEASVASFLDSQGADLSPVAAVAGGMLGGEVVKLISGKDESINNLFVFDAMGGFGGAVVTL